MRGRRVTMPEPRGRKSLPTRLSSTELLPELCAPTTAIWGRSILATIPTSPKAPWSLLTMGMSWSIFGRCRNEGGLGGVALPREALEPNYCVEMRGLRV